MAIAALATRPRKPNNLSRQVARLAASHQISKRRQPNSGPKTATIQYLAAPSSEMPGPNRVASIRRATRNAGQALSGRNCLREASGVLGRSGAFSSVVRSFMRRSPVDCNRADKLAAAREFASTNGQDNLTSFEDTQRIAAHNSLLPTTPGDPRHSRIIKPPFATKSWFETQH